MPLQAEGMARYDAAQIATGLCPQSWAALRLHADQGDLPAFRQRIVGRRGAGLGLGEVRAAQLAVEVIDLDQIVSGGTMVLPVDREVGTGARVAVVPGGVAARSQPVVRCEPGDIFAFDLQAGRMVIDELVALAWHLEVGAGVVHQHQPVVAFTVFEMIGNPPFLAKPTHEFEVAFTELHLVIAYGVAVDQAFLHRVVVEAKHLVQNLLHRLVLKDAAIPVL